jgi:hypothetical protein
MVGQLLGKHQIKNPQCIDKQHNYGFLKYPKPESNRHGFPQVFETSASTNSAIRA